MTNTLANYIRVWVNVTGSDKYTNLPLLDALITTVKCFIARNTVLPWGLQRELHHNVNLRQDIFS
jgi:hypothetical protein